MTNPSHSKARTGGDACCGNCKWRDPKPCHWDGASIGLNRCLYAIELFEAREFNGDCEYVLKKEFADRKAFVQDGSSYAATLLTKPDFYCSQHEALASLPAPQVRG